MVDILRLQEQPEDLPLAPGTEKRSIQSIMQCHRSAVSVLACNIVGRH